MRGTESGGSQTMTAAEAYARSVRYVVSHIDEAGSPECEGKVLAWSAQ
jgi:hypothetical protein